MSLIGTADQSPAERALERLVRGQGLSAVFGLALAVFGLVCLTVPGHLGLSRAGWVLTGLACLVAGIGNAGIALWLRRNYRKRIEVIRTRRSSASGAS